MTTTRSMLSVIRVRHASSSESKNGVTQSATSAGRTPGSRPPCPNRGRAAICFNPSGEGTPSLECCRVTHEEHRRAGRHLDCQVGFPLVGGAVPDVASVVGGGVGRVDSGAVVFVTRAAAVAAAISSSAFRRSRSLRPRMSTQARRRPSQGEHRPAEPVAAANRALDQPMRHLGEPQCGRNRHGRRRRRARPAAASGRGRSRSFGAPASRGPPRRTTHRPAGDRSPPTPQRPRQLPPARAGRPRATNGSSSGRVAMRNACPKGTTAADVGTRRLGRCRTATATIAPARTSAKRTGVA